MDFPSVPPKDSRTLWNSQAPTILSYRWVKLKTNSDQRISFDFRRGILLTSWKIELMKLMELMKKFSWRETKSLKPGRVGSEMDKGWEKGQELQEWWRKWGMADGWINSGTRILERGLKHFCHFLESMEKMGKGRGKRERDQRDFGKLRWTFVRRAWKIDRSLWCCSVKRVNSYAWFVSRGGARRGSSLQGQGRFYICGCAKPTLPQTHLSRRWKTRARKKIQKKRWIEKERKKSF